jgi:hypothetical protein
MSDSTIHAGAVLTGATAVLILGASGSGKSRLALALLNAAAAGLLPFARLVADDRALLEARHGRLLVRPAPPLAGLLELRGVGLLRFPHEPVARVGLAITLGQTGDRLPESGASWAYNGILIPHVTCPSGVDPLPLLLGRLRGDAAAN